LPAYYIVSFDRTAATMEVEKILTENGISHAIMPTPRAVQASCGLSIRFAPADLGRVTQLISKTLEKGIFHYYKAVKEDGCTSFSII
jgi:hypothetical protein